MPTVDVEVADHVATVLFDRPPVNAVDRAAMAEIGETFRHVADDRDVRVVIFTAAGERAFVAGADLKRYDADRKALTHGPPGDRLDPGRLARDTISAIYHCPVPVIGAINGPAIGAGLAYAAVCDLIVASERATFGTTEINVGLLGAASHLQRLVGPYRARKLFFTGALVPAADLEQWGAIERVVPHEHLMTAARELAASLAAKSPIALRLAKASMNRVEFLPIEEAYALEQTYTERLQAFEDSREARAARDEGREPDWRWR